jgi:Pyruvate/2-oxoacid:ferredoxin oxidoreductase delta subunit
MLKTVRKIIKIDEDKCNGCGLCAQACAEGAIKILNGKAKLVSETYCDGLGACIGECPQGALHLEERDAAGFDEHAVQQHLSAAKNQLPCGCPGTQVQSLGAKNNGLEPSCPGSKADSFRREPSISDKPEILPSQLSNWPVQITLIPVNAPYLKGAHLIISADCVSYAFADFHNRFLPGKVLLVGCPKLDDAEAYRNKLAQILALNNIKSIEVVYMEVPCCTGLVRLVKEASAESRKDISLTLTKISIRGKIIETVNI